VTRPIKIIPLEPHYEPGVSMRQMVIMLAVFGAAYAAGITVIILHALGIVP
jgi:hypothetical protein